MTTTTVMRSERVSAYEDLRDLLTFRPLERPIECAYEPSPFSAGWARTVKDLERELRMHGAEQTVLEADFNERDLRLDGLPRADRAARSPGIVLSFVARAVPNSPHLRYEAGKYAKWQDNVRAVAQALEDLRAVDRHGITKRGEQYAGWKALTAGAGGDGDPARGRELVRKAGNVAAALKAAHPDHGGEPGDFRDVIAYRDSRPRG